MKERDDYYNALEACSNGSRDIAGWQEFAATDLNPRQKKVISRLLDAGKGNFEGKLAARNYRTLAKTTKATASRDLDNLLQKGVLELMEGGKRRRVNSQ